MELHVAIIYFEGCPAVLPWTALRNPKDLYGSAVCTDLAKHSEKVVQTMWHTKSEAEFTQASQMVYTRTASAVFY